MTSTGRSVAEEPLLRDSNQALLKRVRRRILVLELPKTSLVPEEVEHLEAIIRRRGVILSHENSIMCMTSDEDHQSRCGGSRNRSP